MTDHQPLPVSGYRAQGNEAITIVNANKAAEERVLRLIDALKADPSVDHRWLAIGRSQIEQGFMAVNRAIFKPRRIALEGDVKAPSGE